MLEDTTASPPAAASAFMPWPFSAVWLGDHLSRDVARFWSRMAGVSDPMEAAQAEADLGASLWRDWATAVEQMWMLPMTVWAAAANPPAPEASS